MRKIFVTIWILLLTAGLALSLLSCTTTALWRSQSNDTKNNQADVSVTNPSEKYIVYAALNNAGRLILRPEEGDPEATASYAVVGYTGLIPDLVIPATYGGLLVTQVLLAEDYDKVYCFRNVTAGGAPIAYTGDDARFTNEQNASLLKSIVFGVNVSYVGSAVCAAMTSLESVSFQKTSSVTLAQNAFLACPSLTSVSFAASSGSVTLNGNFAGLTPTYAS